MVRVALWKPRPLIGGPKNGKSEVTERELGEGSEGKQPNKQDGGSSEAPV